MKLHMSKIGGIVFALMLIASTGCVVGEVTDANTGEIIADVLVELKACPTCPTLDEDLTFYANGHYLVGELDEDQTGMFLEFSKPGYQTEEVEIQPEQCNFVARYAAFHCDVDLAMTPL